LRILGIDFWDKRIGVAISDELGLTAQGERSILRKNNRQVLDEIRQLVQRYDVEAILIGYPLRLDGTKGIQCEKVDRFSDLLTASLQKPVIKWDESLSTKDAEDILREGGIHGKKRRQLVDKVAAALILQHYLDHLPGKDLGRQVSS
jgi:putative Holliday junction resolvase